MLGIVICISLLSCFFDYELICSALSVLFCSVLFCSILYYIRLSPSYVKAPLAAGLGMSRISSLFAHVTNSVPMVPQSVGESIHGGHALRRLDGCHGSSVRTDQRWSPPTARRVATARGDWQRHAMCCMWSPLSSPHRTLSLSLSLPPSFYLRLARTHRCNPGDGINTTNQQNFSLSLSLSLRSPQRINAFESQRDASLAQKSETLLARKIRMEQEEREKKAQELVDKYTSAEI